MKGPVDYFSLHLELQGYIPLFQALFKFSYRNAVLWCLIDWMVLAIQLTGWFVAFEWTG